MEHILSIAMLNFFGTYKNYYFKRAFPNTASLKISEHNNLSFFSFLFFSFQLTDDANFKVLIE